MKHLTRALFIAALSTLSFACSSDEEKDPTGSSKGSIEDCYAIIDACHEKDDGSGGDITLCHETAHRAELRTDGDFSFCTKQRARCVSACDAAPPFDGGHGGSHHHGGAGGHHHGGAGGHHHGGAGGHLGGTGGDHAGAGGGH
ncbi:MAG: hypothetical protein KF915_17005 [Polyangiaceae bacterium]|nr:hypothetical protein [Polyangiaceae bacterium]